MRKCLVKNPKRRIFIVIKRSIGCNLYVLAVNTEILNMQIIVYCYIIEVVKNSSIAIPLLIITAMAVVAPIVSSIFVSRILLTNN